MRFVVIVGVYSMWTASVVTAQAGGQPREYFEEPAPAAPIDSAGGVVTGTHEPPPDVRAANPSPAAPSADEAERGQAIDAPSPPASPPVVYVQPSPRALALQAENEQTRFELAKHGLAPAIVTLSVGAGLMLGSAYMLLWYYSSYDVYWHEANVLRATGVGALIGAGITAAGAVMLIRRLSARRPLKHRIRELQFELERERTLVPAPLALPGGIGLTVSSRF